MSINNAVDLKKKICAAKMTSENIKIQISNIDNLDLTFIQLIYSLKNNLSELGKKVEIHSELPENTEKLLRNSGFNKIINTV